MTNAAKERDLGTIIEEIGEMILADPSATLNLVSGMCNAKPIPSKEGVASLKVPGTLAEDFRIPSDKDQKATPRIPEISVWTEAVWTGVRIMEQLRREGIIISYDCSYFELGRNYKERRIVLLASYAPENEVPVKSRYWELFTTPTRRTL